MTQPSATFGITIVGDNRVERGARAAERRLGQISRHAGVAGDRAARDTERSLGRGTRRIVRTFGEVERAGARIFGGRSITSGIGARLGGIGEAASAAGSGLGEAAAAGGGLSTALGVLGVAAGATVGLLAAAAYKTITFVNDWAKSAATIGRTAETIGVSTKALQEFSAAAERAGIDKDKAVGSLGGLSQTLNDARYGRNTAALGLLAKLGVAMKVGADGDVDVAAMLPALQQALSRQTSSGQRTAARGLGIDLGALQAFTNPALVPDMADADSHAAVIAPDDISRARRIVRKSAMVGQLKDRAASETGSFAANKLERGYDATLSGGQALMDGANDFRGTVDRVFRPAAGRIDRGGGAIERGGHAIERAAGSLMQRLRAALPAAHAAERETGVPTSIQLGQYVLESGAGRHMPAGSNNPWGIKARRGEPSVGAMTTEVINGRSVRVMQRFRKFDTMEESFRAHARLLATGRAMANARRHGYDVDAYADELGGGTSRDPRYATDPNYGRKMRRIIHGQGLTDYDHGRGEIPVKVEIEMRGAPAGTRARVTAGPRAHPAVSHAFQPQ